MAGPFGNAIPTETLGLGPDAKSLGEHDQMAKGHEFVRPESEQLVSATLWARGLKRAFDLSISLIGLMLVSPVLLTAMALVKLTSRGPIFFVQVRTGWNNREFRPLKLRSMRGDRQPDPSELVPLDHPEVTAVGRLFRRLKIDELPQILNVVNGDMSLVGPRPTLPEQTRAYDDFKRRRLLVRPGLTGLAQVNGNASISWGERIKYDVHYTRHHGFWMDLTILGKTIAVLLRGEQHFARPYDESPYSSQRPDSPTPSNWKGEVS